MAWRSPDRSRRGQVRAHAGLAGRASPARSRPYSSASRRKIRPTPAAALRPHLAPGGLCRLRPERAGRSRSSPRPWASSVPSVASSISAPTIWGPGVVMYGGRGAVVVGELDGATTPRAAASCARLLRDFEPDARLTGEHLGLSLEQADLRGPAVRHGAHRRFDRGRAGRSALSPDAGRTGARGGRVAAAEGVVPWKPSTASTRSVRARRGPTPRSRQSFDDMVALQPALGQVAQRHLARSGRAQTARPRSTPSSCPILAGRHAGTGWPSPCWRPSGRDDPRASRGRRSAMCRPDYWSGRPRRRTRHEHRLRRPRRPRHRRGARVRPHDSARLRRRGATVWACDLNDEGLTETPGTCGGAAARIRSTSVTAPRSRPWSERASRRTAIDILVNNAGGVRGQVGRPLEEITQGGLADDRRR